MIENEDMLVEDLLSSALSIFRRKSPYVGPDAMKWQQMADNAPVSSVEAPSGISQPMPDDEYKFRIGGVLAASGLLPGPSGDVLGPVADAYMYMSDPSSRTPGNFALSALGLLPFIPSVASMKGVTDLGSFKKSQKEEIEYMLDTSRHTPEEVKLQTIVGDKIKRGLRLTEQQLAELSPEFRKKYAARLSVSGKAEDLGLLAKYGALQKGTELAVQAKNLPSNILRDVIQDPRVGKDAGVVIGRVTKTEDVFGRPYLIMQFDTKYGPQFYDVPADATQFAGQDWGQWKNSGFSSDATPTNWKFLSDEENKKRSMGWDAREAYAKGTRPSEVSDISQKKPKK